MRAAGFPVFAAIPLLPAHGSLRGGPFWGYLRSFEAQSSYSNYSKQLLFASPKCLSFSHLQEARELLVAARLVTTPKGVRESVFDLADAIEIVGREMS